MREKKVFLAVAVLLIFHAVGLYGLAFSDNPAYFRALSPLNLLLTAGLLFAFHKTWNQTFLIFALVVFLVGFASEIIGVHTGLLYGNYVYGAALGFKLFDIPLIIGLNWLLLVYSTGVLLQPFRLPWYLKALISAGLMVLLDMLIEPVAAVLDFWTWENYQIPASNYWGWLGVAFLLHLYFQKVNFLKQNPLVPFVYAVQFLFFLALNFAL